MSIMSVVITADVFLFNGLFFVVSWFKLDKTNMMAYYGKEYPHFLMF